MTEFSFSWQAAVRVPGVIFSEEQRRAGWPDALTLRNAVRLQFPTDGDSAEKTRARREQNALLAALDSAIAAGALPATKHVRTIDPPADDSDLFRPIPLAPDLGIEPARPVEFSRSLPDPAPRVEAFYTVERAAFRDFLRQQGIEPSAHIKAWLVPVGQAAPAKAKRVTQADRVADWANECERRAREMGLPFDRNEMPGTKSEFLALLRALDPEFLGIKKVASLDRYLSGLKWKGGKQEGALPIFARLFPEIGSRLTGAVEPKRRKA